jgi:transposase
VESPVRGDSHAGFGGRSAETEWPKGHHRAAGRPYLGGEAVDKVRRDEYNQQGRSGTEAGKWIKGTRYSLLKDTANQTAKQLLKLAEVVTTNKRLYRTFLLYGELRYIYRLPKEEAPERLDAWLAWESRSRLKPFVKLARTIRKHKAGVLAAIELGLSNGAWKH